MGIKAFTGRGYLAAAVVLAFLAWAVWTVQQRSMLICFVRPLKNGAQQIIIGHRSESGLDILSVHLKAPTGFYKRFEASVDGGSISEKDAGMSEGQESYTWSVEDLKAKGAFVLTLSSEDDLKLIQNSELVLWAVREKPWPKRVFEQRIRVAALRRG